MKNPVVNPRAVKGFAVYVNGKPVFTSSSAALCHTFKKDNLLKGAKVGYAK